MGRTRICLKEEARESQEEKNIDVDWQNIKEDQPLNEIPNRNNTDECPDPRRKMKTLCPDMLTPLTFFFLPRKIESEKLKIENYKHRYETQKSKNSSFR